MKEATGELNMTVVTIILIGVVLGVFWLIFRNVENTVNEQWNNTTENHSNIDIGYRDEHEITVEDYTMNF